MSRDVTPAEVLELTGPTKNFLCPLSANSYGIEFQSFTIEDYDTKKLIFEVSRDRPPKLDLAMLTMDENAMRKIKYSFSEDVLRLPAIKTSLVFGVGRQELRGFRMIERHYFRDKLIKSFDFTFGFCIPGSTNTWDAVYAVPPLEESLVQEMIANPHETKSDSFYFVGNKLVMHNKASYEYIVEDRAQEKRSYDYLNESKFGAKGAKGAKGSKYDAGVAEDKGAKSEGAGASGGGSKAAAKYEEDVWSKEADYY
eukprot:CAMPEP_0118967060 /NCGR_PEP_ID=MMETSP1173-20130426/4477_1 /TAXON_ID=1034831 /ORGANISM="Rhizochromulina marina cf, Strain CCMP1243" /LENGTH=253 /DNA_ID=CAMNT_0006915957 /DNA_START=209 /DNA_END=970 /DNA_ORIENTATION=+